MHRPSYGLPCSSIVKPDNPTCASCLFGDRTFSTMLNARLPRLGRLPFGRWARDVVSHRGSSCVGTIVQPIEC